ncbi:hypothetical protein [Thermoanaerobacter thermocopriae]|uniref:hypothetical protein n=1 Tax=Thermoanaerobacter thermocopriae TaxID=29350 RepID=UPI00048E4C13|nr:hypothetical protein [Thermoanaerobacter thermocopriae]
MLIGLLFVPKEKKNMLLDELTYYREKEDYKGEIHFSALPKKFKGKFEAKARVARAWMEAYENVLHEMAYFSALAVYRGSLAFEHHRFSKEFHEYNRFTAMVLKAGIAWHLVPKNYDFVTITFFPDAKERSTWPEVGCKDNFEEYILYRAELDSYLSRCAGKVYPRVFIQNIKLVDSAKEDLIQLTDLLLGTVQSALVAGSRQETKITLGEMLLKWQKDLENPPLKQNYKLHRKLNIWAFPDENGQPFIPKDFALEKILNENQISLF